MEKGTQRIESVKRREGKIIALLKEGDKGVLEDIGSETGRINR